MLEASRSEKMRLLLERLRCRIELPAQLADLETRRGVLPGEAHDMRRSPRMYCPGKVLVESFATLPAIPRNHQFVIGYTVDISATGLRFLHDTELYPGESVTIWTTVQRLACTVIRCRRLNAHCYEVGATFEEEDPALKTPEAAENQDPTPHSGVHEYMN